MTRPTESVSERIRRLREQLFDLSPRSTPPRDASLRAGDSSPEEDAILERFLPFGELILLVASADGHIAQTEERAVTGAFVALTGGRVSRATLAKVRSEAKRRLESSSRAERLESVCSDLSMHPDDAELAFALASAVALADDRVAVEEHALLREVARYLGRSVGELGAEPLPAEP